MAQKYAPHLLNLISDMAAQGLTVADIGEAFNLTESQARKWVSENIEIKKALKDGQERAAMVEGDERRRSRLDQMQAKFFIPDDRDLEIIEDLARYGWSEVKIAEHFDVSVAIFLNAKKKFPELEKALSRGVAQSEGRKMVADIKAWKPTPGDIDRIACLAEEGLTLDSIAAEMRISPATLLAKRDEVPEIDQAYRTGFAKAKADVERQLLRAAQRGNERLLPFWLKTRDKDNYSEAPAKGSMGPALPAAAGPVILDLPKPGDQEQFDKDSERFKRDKRIADANAK